MACRQLPLSTFFVAIVAVISIATSVTFVDALPIEAESLPVPGGTIRVEFGEGKFNLPRKVLLDHVSRAACAVSAYYHRFPVSNDRIQIVPVEGRRGVLGGTTWAFGGAHSRILIGEQTAIADLKEDWIVTHEMIHTAFPTVGTQHHWIEEGIATYWFAGQAVSSDVALDCCHARTRQERDRPMRFGANLFVVLSLELAADVGRSKKVPTFTHSSPSVR